MPLETQGKIVRVLQEQTFERVGGHTGRGRCPRDRLHQPRFRPRRCRAGASARISTIASASCRSACRACASGARISRCCSIISCAARRRSPAAGAHHRAGRLAALQAYDWPGNVRQLRNVVDWLLIMAPGEPAKPIRADMLPPDIDSIAPSPIRGNDGLEMMSLPLREAREVFERRYLMPRSAASGAISPRPRPSSAWNARRCIASCGRWGSRRAIGRSGAKAERPGGTAIHA